MIKHDMAALKQFPINAAVTVTDYTQGEKPQVRLGTVVNHALNSLGELVVGVRMIVGIGQAEEIHYVHPKNRMMAIKRF